MQLLYIDLFCGAGGTSTGVERARIDGRKCAEVIACVNHDANAIASHAANHPRAMHFTEDIRTLDLGPLKVHAAEKRREYPTAKLVLWASLECTNHSRAKGGMSRDADSRTLADHLFRYIEELQPDYIQIENVVEFMEWGPLVIKEAVGSRGEAFCPLEIKHDRKHKTTTVAPVWIPDPDNKGTLYRKWVARVRKYGYDFEYHVLNAADYGAYTSRIRYFGQFARKGLPIAWPKQTHAKNPKQNLVSAHYLLNPQYRSVGGSVDAPCFTLIARMDKRPPYLVSVEQGVPAWCIRPDDTPAMRRLKEFCIDYGIVDVTMRMLRIAEMKRIQGFGTDYVLIGTQEEQKKFLGNAVVTEMATALCEAICMRLHHEDAKQMQATA